MKVLKIVERDVSEKMRLRVFDSQGRQMLEHRLTAAAAPQRVGLPEQLHPPGSISWK